MDKQSAKKLAKLLEFEKDFKTNPAVAILSENEKVISAVQEVKDEVEIIKDDSQKIVEAINTLDQTKATKEELEYKLAGVQTQKGDRGFKGERGEKGEKGDKGDKGDTVIVDKIIERTEVIKEQPIIKTEVVKEIKTDLEPEAIRDRLESLKEENRLDASAIKGLERFQKTVNTAIQSVGNRVAGVSKIVAGSNVTISSTNPNGTGEVTVNATVPPSDKAFTDLTDTFSSYTGLAGQGLRVNATEDGIDTYTPTDTDEKVKYDASDPTAGYIADKFVAGTGISLAEGTGADENKLQITNSAPDQTVSITDSGIATVTGTYPNFNIDVPATDLTNYFNKTTDDTDDITDTATNRFTNDTDITRLANTSGTNTGDVSVTDSSEIDFTLTGQNITASLKSGSIDETKLDTSVNASLDLADTALQSETDPVFGASEAANFVAGDKSKLDGIEAGAEVNVNADWNAVSGDAQILNKPSIPSQYTDEMAQDAVGNAVGNGLDYDDPTGAISVDETELLHNSLGSKQGGTTNEYYHLTSAQHGQLHAPVTVADSSEIDLTLTGQQISASIVAGSIDETKLDTSVNASLDLADTALQSFTETDPVFTASDFSGKAVVTTVGTPGSDTNIPTEQAVREAISASGGGDVTGPASSTDNGIVLFDGLTGKLIKDSTKTLSAYFEKAVDDTDDISEGTTNKFATAAEKTKLGHITVTQAVDLDTLESDTATNNAKVTNATHTGEVTGATALAVDKTAISNRTGVTAASTDYVLIGDASDTDNLKKATAQSIADLYSETDPVWTSEKGDYFNKTTDDTDDISEGATNKFDQTVSLTAGAGISVTGTYPSFTVANTVTDTGITQLTGDVTAGPGSGSQATTIAAGAVTNGKIGTAAVTYDKIQNVTAERLLGRHSGTNGAPQEIQLGTGLSFSGDTLNTSSAPGSAVWGSISGDIDDQTDLATLLADLKKSVLTVPIKGRYASYNNQAQIVVDTGTYIKIPYSGTITGWNITENSKPPIAGSIVIDVWKDTTANYPPTAGDSIAGSEKPTLSSQTNNEDLTLTTWTTSVAAGDYIGFNVDSVDGCKNVLLEIIITKN